MEALATVGELETHLQRTLENDQAELALELASGAVRAYCRWDLSREHTTMYVEGSGTTLLSLPTLELIAVDEVRADGVVLNPVDCPYSYGRKGQLWGSWAPRVQYEFDVEHGYDPLPDVLKLVTLDVATRNLTNPEGLTAATTGQVSRTWGGRTAGGMSSLHERLLDRYSL